MNPIVKTCSTCEKQYLFTGKQNMTAKEKGHKNIKQIPEPKKNHIFVE